MLDMNKRFVSVLLLVIVFYAAFNYYGTRSILLPREYSADISYFWNIVKETKAKDISYYVNAYSDVGKMITIYGNVTQRLSPDITPPRHEIFLLSDLNDTSKHLKIIYNVDYLGRGWLNVKVGDLIVLVGELLPDAKSVHKIAEGLDFLVLFRPGEDKVIEVGYLPDNDQIWLIGIGVTDISILILILILKRKRLI